jgi:hypothetical protein
MDKYLGNASVINWFQRPSHKQSVASRIWNSLTNNCFVVLHWLRWCPGSGLSVSLGRDRILGMANRSILLESILSDLQGKHLAVLAHVVDRSREHTFPESWLCSDSLGLSGVHAVEWQGYCTTLRGTGIKLRTRRTH